MPERTGRIRRHAHEDEPGQDPGAEIPVIRRCLQGPLQIFGRQLRRAVVPFHLREQPEPLGTQRGRQPAGASAIGQPTGGRHITGLQGRKRLTERSAREIFLPAGRREPAGRLEKLGRGVIRPPQRRPSRARLHHGRGLVVWN